MPKFCKICLCAVEHYNLQSLREDEEITITQGHCIRRTNLFPLLTFCKSCTNTVNATYYWIYQIVQTEEQLLNKITYFILEENSNQNMVDQTITSPEIFREAVSEETINVVTRQNEEISLPECRVVVTPLEVVIKQNINKLFGTTHDNNCNNQENTAKSNENPQVRDCYIKLIPLEQAIKIPQ